LPPSGQAASLSGFFYLLVKQMEMNCTIGIVGYGRFGKLAARYLSVDFPVRVYDPAATIQDAVSSGTQLVPLEVASRCKVVILAVPISRLQHVLNQVRPYLVPDSLVVDVCSVKEFPVRWMQERLPSSVEILATHPMFGPDSAAESLQGRKIVLCPVRITAPRYQAVRSYLIAKGLVAIESDPSLHDRQIAISLALTHFIGRSLAGMGAKPQDIDTEGYTRLLRILEVVENDTWQLFEDMHRFNPYAQEARRRFIASMQGIEKKIE
jgi:prephenate dehydrogenase